MRIVRGLRALRRPPRRAVVTIGMFDGVHLAHQRLIRSTIRVARRWHGTSVVITFDPDPQAVLDPTHTPPALMPIEERLRYLADLGVDCAWVIPFTRQFARSSAMAFVRDVLAHRLAAKAVLVGENFAFGARRHGDVAILKRLGPSYGMRVIPLARVRQRGQTVSSSRIRQLVARGRLHQARELLGRAPALYGVVVHGSGRGRQLGIPTANVRLIPQVLPPRGVYAVLVRERGGRSTWQGVMNLGVRPTFGPGPLTCEVHLLEFSGSLLRRHVVVSLLARVRGERHFANAQALVRQIHRDLARAHRMFSQTR